MFPVWWSASLSACWSLACLLAALPRTWVAVLLGHKLLGDAEEAAVSLAAWLLQVHAALGLNPVEQDGLSEQQGACTQECGNMQGAPAAAAAASEE